MVMVEVFNNLLRWKGLVIIYGVVLGSKTDRESRNCVSNFSGRECTTIMGMVLAPVYPIPTAHIYAYSDQRWQKITNPLNGITTFHQVFPLLP